MPNYVANVPGLPYRRVRKIVIDYPQPNNAHIACFEVDVIPMVGGHVVPMSVAGVLEFDLGPVDFASSVQLVDPGSGADIPGATMQVGTVMLGMLGIVRWKQPNGQFLANTPGLAYTRTPQIEIIYDQPLTAQVTCKQVEAVLLTDGTVYQIRDLEDFQFSLKGRDFQSTFLLHYPDTGLEVGAAMTVQQVMLGILAVIRAKQIERDGQ